LVTSVIFSLAHFIDPDASRFMGDGLLHTAWQVLYGMFADMPAHHFFRLRLLNLVLLGCVLCLFTARSGSIWLSVGTHAGCVWIMKLNGFLTDTMHPVSQATRLLGQRSDMTDSLMGTAALGLLGVCGLMAIRRIRP
jgi:membrane protease YdiL (CAAX protease family)